MAYILESLISQVEILREGCRSIPKAKIIRLKCNLGLLPLTDDFFETIGGGDCGELMKLSEVVEDLAKELSIKHPVIYAEAEYFGGTGAQSAVVWSQGKRVLELIRQEHSINRALNFLGVRIKDKHDEFDEVGLGLCRCTEDWLKNPEAKE
ncbi:MAG: hypothetical protein U1F65_03730 [Verrucomicrobiota bacterium]